MNLFEKIFNYQIMSRLGESGVSSTTAQERAWLKTMLQRPGAEALFSDAAYRKLMDALEEEAAVDFNSGFAEKVRHVEQSLFHPLIRTLRSYVAGSGAVQLTMLLKDGSRKERQPAYLYKLEYSMVKREWYLLWYHLRNKALLSTKLKYIQDVVPFPSPIAADRIERVRQEIAALLTQRKRSATIEVVKLYNRELSRILYAFSCFEKEVEYDEGNDVYRIRVSVQSDELEYLLLKVRFLGQRVKIVEGDHLRRRMLESATLALRRYGEAH